jgi:tetratricopeptide (TPR) repeat protein
MAVSDLAPSPERGLSNNRLAELAVGRQVLTKRRLWVTLGAERREKVALAFLQTKRAAVRTAANNAIGRERSFRAATVAGWPDEKVAHAMARIDLRDSPWAWSAIVHDQTVTHGKMVGEFLRKLGLPMKSGSTITDELPDKPFSAAQTFRAADLIAERYDAEDVVVCLCALQLKYPEHFGHCSDWMQLQLADGLGASSAAPGAPRQPAQPEPSDSGTRVEGFTTLDNLLIRLVVDSAAGIVGAPSVDEADDAIDELVQLSSSRQQTFFHCGFRDAVFGREPAETLAAENSSRRRWYWSGYVSGVARRADFGRIAELFDNFPGIAEIAHIADAAASSAAWLVFRAMAESGRYGEAAGLANPALVSKSADLRMAMLTTATGLVRSSRAAEARLLLDPLWKARPKEEGDEDNQFWLWVKRRRALCLRQLGEQAEAKDLLKQLAQHQDLTVRAVALTDLGLLRSGYRSLGEITLPAKHEELADFIAALERGEPEFRKAISDPEFRPAHAEYALGLLETAHERFDLARGHLDLALSYFSGSPELYRADGSLAIAELYLGVAIGQAMNDPGRLPRACELIRSGLQGGAKLPNWLVRSTVDSLSVGRSDLGIATATDLIAHDDSALDALVTSEAGQSTPALTNALFARAAQPSRPAPERVQDYLRVLPMLLRDGSVERAADALLYLEERATEGIGTGAVVDLLAKPESYSPAWTVDRADEARVRLLESQGRLAEAATLLEQVCWRLLSRECEYVLDEAELFVGHLEGYGDAGAEAVGRLAGVVEAHRAAADEDGEDGSEIDERPVRILVVGGNEIQAKMDVSISARVRAEMAGVEVEFLHSGWGGDWTPYAEEFKRREGDVDGVVILSLMRTTLGRTIRHDCRVPWRGCRGRGQGQIVEAIRRVVPMARQRLASLSA